MSQMINPNQQAMKRRFAQPQPGVPANNQAAMPSAAGFPPAATPGAAPMPSQMPMGAPSAQVGGAAPMGAGPMPGAIPGAGAPPGAMPTAGAPGAMTPPVNATGQKPPAQAAKKKPMSPMSPEQRTKYRQWAESKGGGNVQKLERGAEQVRKGEGTEAGKEKKAMQKVGSLTINIS